MNIWSIQDAQPVGLAILATPDMPGPVRVCSKTWPDGLILFLILFNTERVMNLFGDEMQGPLGAGFLTAYNIE